MEEQSPAFTAPGGSLNRTWDTDTNQDSAAAQNTRLPHASVSPLPSPRALRQALGPQCPNAFTALCLHHSIYEHLEEEAQKTPSWLPAYALFIISQKAAAEEKTPASEGC